MLPTARGLLVRLGEPVMAPVVVCVAQAFKETLRVGEVASALAAGVAAAGAVPRVILGSDGGDGFLDALAPPRRTSHTVTGPLGHPVVVDVGWLDRETAVVETRLACGLALIPPERRDPLRTTTRGVGELLEAVVAAGAGMVLAGLGGSATVDGGLGAARAWGWGAWDDRDQSLVEGGGALERLAALEPAPAPGARVVALADVRNRLTGPDGAIVYAPQKGADRAAMARLDAGLARLAEVAAPWGGPAQARREGAGAAGGLGFGLLCFAGADLVPGAAWVLDRHDLAGALDGAALAVIAEARFDATSLSGKLAGEVIARAGAAGVPVAVVAPTATLLPGDVSVTTAPGRWDVAALARHTERAVRAALRLSPS
jgi:glycerate kinase